MSENGEKKAILLSRAQADLKSFVSKDATRVALNNINVTSTYAEATEGHVLLRVPHDNTIDPAHFPAVNGIGSGLNGNSVLVKPEALEKAFKHIDPKSCLPILGYVHLSVDEKDTPILTATDLETSVHVRQQKMDATFPDTDQVIPQEPRPLSVCLNAELVKKLADWACKHGRGPMPTIKLYISSRSGAVLCKIPRGDSPSAIAIIMPVRSDDPQDHMIPKLLLTEKVSRLEGTPGTGTQSSQRRRTEIAGE